MRKCIPIVAACSFLVMGYVPRDDGNTIIASFYQSGEITANGEKFEPMGMTAAHRRYKFGTLLRVTHLETGKSVIVRINDRGPYIDGRSLDLSRGAAEAIGMIEEGIAEVEIARIN
jgi:rare lipoprotein A